MSFTLNESVHWYFIVQHYTTREIVWMNVNENKAGCTTTIAWFSLIPLHCLWRKWSSNSRCYLIYFNWKSLADYVHYFLDSFKNSVDKLWMENLYFTHGTAQLDDRLIEWGVTEWQWHIAQNTSRVLNCTAVRELMKMHGSFFQCFQSASFLVHVHIM